MQPWGLTGHLLCARAGNVRIQRHGSFLLDWALHSWINIVVILDFSLQGVTTQAMPCPDPLQSLSQLLHNPLLLTPAPPIKDRLQATRAALPTPVETGNAWEVTSPKAALSPWLTGASVPDPRREPSAQRSLQDEATCCGSTPELSPCPCRLPDLSPSKPVFSTSPASKSSSQGLLLENPTKDPEQASNPPQLWVPHLSGRHN